MVDKAGNRSNRISPHAAGRSDAVERPAEISKKANPARPTLADPDAPKDASVGTYHQRSLASTGPSALINVHSMRRAERVKEPEFAHEGAVAFAQLLQKVGSPGREGVESANLALDSVLNYIDQRTDHGNQVGSLHAQIAATPPHERVPLLRRAVHILRKAVKDGVLPAGNLDDLNRLARVGQGMGWNFDFDDNIASMDTKIILFHKSTNEEHSLSTNTFAEVREQIGQEGPLADFEVRADGGRMDSFRNFRDMEDPGVFWRDLSDAMASSDWKGPSWSAFQQAMSSPTTAQWSTIITARGHYPNTIHAALRSLVDQGHLENVPPRENIFPVSLPGLDTELGGDASSPSVAKVRVMEKYLDRLQAAPFGPSTQPVIPPDGSRNKKYMHLWGFSDDDYGTFKKTVDELGEQVKSGRWPDVKITVYFTGQGHPESDAHAVVIMPNGESRRQQPAEVQEVDRTLEGIAKLERSQSAGG